MFRMVSTIAWLLISIVVAYGQSPDQLAFFEKNVRPLLAEKCYACHSAKTMAMGELRLDSKAAVLRGGSRGAAIVPSDPDASLLVKAIRYRTIDLRMPPTGKLADNEIADIETWIEMGAPDPRGDEPAPQVTEKKIDLEGGRQFWSFQPVRDPALPEVRDPAWVRTDVDRFVLAKLASNRFEPAAEADRRTLLRRLTFDLTGLPPSPEEIDQFLSDSAPNAYEKVVDRLLASPHYGERWGRHWLEPGSLGGNQRT